MSCNCGDLFANLGNPSCTLKMKDITKLILVPTYNSVGLKNNIGGGDTLNEAYFIDKINAVDKTERWYPIDGFVENLESTRGEPIMQTFNSDRKKFIREGVRTLKCLLPEAGATLKKAFDSFKCSAFSMYFVDSDGVLWGDYTNGYLLPVSMENESFSAQFIFPKAKEVQGVELYFEFSQSFSDGRFMALTSAEAGVNFLTLESILDVEAVITGISQTGFTAKLSNTFGTFKTKTYITGLVKADFTLYNNTGSASITITTVTESVVDEGSYVFVIPSQTVADVLNLKLAIDGFEMSELLTIA